MAASGCARSVLIVDDDASLREVIAGVLEMDGYELMLARDGKEALAMLLSMPNPGECVVVTDMQMPRMNGRQLTRAIRSEPDLSRARILMLSATLTASDALDTDASMQKPFDVRELRAIVRELFASAAKAA